MAFHTSSTSSLWQEKWVIGFRFRVNRVVYTSFLVTRYTSRRSRDVPFILSQLIFNIPIVRCCPVNDCDNKNDLLTTVDSKYHRFFREVVHEKIILLRAQSNTIHYWCQIQNINSPMCAYANGVGCVSVTIEHILHYITFEKLQ
jgi:hypothetical protein